MNSSHIMRGALRRKSRRAVTLAMSCVRFYAAECFCATHRSLKLQTLLTPQSHRSPRQFTEANGKGRGAEQIGRAEQGQKVRTLSNLSSPAIGFFKRDFLTYIEL